MTVLLDCCSPPHADSWWSAVFFSCCRMSEQRCIDWCRVFHLWYDQYFDRICRILMAVSLWNSIHGSCRTLEDGGRLLYGAQNCSCLKKEVLHDMLYSTEQRTWLQSVLPCRKAFAAFSLDIDVVVFADVGSTTTGHTLMCRDWCLQLLPLS